VQAEPGAAHPLVLFNTMARRKQPFAPRPDQGDRVSLYCCGVTVYDYSHIGARPAGAPSTYLARLPEEHDCFVSQESTLDARPLPDHSPACRSTLVRTLHAEAQRHAPQWTRALSSSYVFLCKGVNSGPFQQGMRGFTAASTCSCACCATWATA